MIRQATPRNGKCPPQILVVEDDEDIRDSLREALESDGYPLATIPVVVVTAAGDRGNTAQADLMIKKPVD